MRAKGGSINTSAFVSSMFRPRSIGGSTLCQSAPHDAVPLSRAHGHSNCTFDAPRGDVHLRPGGPGGTQFICLFLGHGKLRRSLASQSHVKTGGWRLVLQDAANPQRSAHKDKTPTRLGIADWLAWRCDGDVEEAYCRVTHQQTVLASSVSVKHAAE